LFRVEVYTVTLLDEDPIRKEMTNLREVMRVSKQV
jgi:hypothetical protein